MKPETTKRRERPNKLEYFMKIATDVAARSTCLRHQIGTVITVDGRIRATGYNGAPSGMRHCIDVGCLRNAENIPSGMRIERCRAIHSEMNAIIDAGQGGARGGILYCTHMPCITCLKHIISAGIKRIVFEHSYPNEDADALILEARNITLVRYYPK